MVPFEALVDYEDPYVQPLILSALHSVLPSFSYKLTDTLPTDGTPTLQFRSYETLDFEAALSNPSSMINAYIIRKALIRKHYLSNTIASWVTKNPSSCLKRHFKPAVEFELDYAEFLDDALLECYELHDAFAHNEGKEPADREWWILKPGMSDRGQGIRLFSTERELTDIFEQWEAENPDDSDEDVEEDEDEDETEEVRESSEVEGHGKETTQQGSNPSGVTKDYITTSHLRHFIAQPYIHPPLLLPMAPYRNRKFHIRTYVVVTGALRVYVYDRMLALFASETYAPPWETCGAEDEEAGPDELLQRLRNVHLTNTCVQSSSAADGTAAGPQANESVHLLSSLPLPKGVCEDITSQIRSATAEMFRAAASQPTNFQALPNCFEVFGVDFLVADDEENQYTALLLEVNAFPDFGRTGDDLRDVVIKGLFEDVAGVVIGPHFGLNKERQGGTETLVEVLDLDLGRR